MSPGDASTQLGAGRPCQEMSGSGLEGQHPVLFLSWRISDSLMSRDQFLSIVPRGQRQSAYGAKDKSQGQAKAAIPSRPPRACNGKAKLGMEAKTRARGSG